MLSKRTIKFFVICRSFRSYFICLVKIFIMGCGASGYNAKITNQLVVGNVASDAVKIDIARMIKSSFLEHLE